MSVRQEDRQTTAKKIRKKKNRKNIFQIVRESKHVALVHRYVLVEDQGNERRKLSWTVSWLADAQLVPVFTHNISTFHKYRPLFLAAASASARLAH